MNRVCVLDPGAYSQEDLAGTLAALGPWWSQMVAGRDEADALVITQVADAAGAVAKFADRAGIEVPPPPEDDLHKVIAWLDLVGEPLSAIVLGADTSIFALAAEAVVVAVDDILDAGDRLRAAGVLPRSVTGMVAALHLGDGGVPKHPQDELFVERRGVVGDRQASRRHHGRPWQSVSLWSQEVIDDFAAQGHDLAPGRAGENITVAGLPWEEVRAGVRLALGAALVEITVFALPCSKNAQWFSDGRFSHMHHRNGPVSRVYAAVLRPGLVRVGDAAVLEPDEQLPLGFGRD